PLGEVLVVVDTDLPAPRLAGRLRIDTYGTDGTWYATRDVALARPGDWPTSFGAYIPDAASERAAIVRLRVYPDGKVRDYRGGRFEPRVASGAPLAAPPLPEPTGTPRLRDDAGNDIPPASEPQPLLSVDRLLRVRVVPGVRSSVHVTL